jgi:UDP-N-acetylglucosamine 2-epimerase
VVIVQGDTTTAFAASLAAFYARIRIAHVEAGLRSGDLSRPFPEEGNRKLIDVLSDVLLAPTPMAKQNLLAEGFPDNRIAVTGNTGIDALFMAVEVLQREPPRELPVTVAPGERLVLVTAHRRESFGPGLSRICDALRRLVELHADLRVLFPVHPNPRVRQVVRACLSGYERIHLSDPLPYPDFVAALLAANVVLTDSGGIQEECPALGKPLLVLRETTERPEGLAAGVAELVGTDVDKIVQGVSAALKKTDEAACARYSPYGDGKACVRVLEVFKSGRLKAPFDGSTASAIEYRGTPWA